jgi:hypothetical protein
MDPAAGRRRRRAQVDAPSGRGIWIETGDRPGDELAEVLDAAVDVAAASRAAGPDVARARMRSRKPGANRSTCASIRSVMSTVEPFGTWQ